jgi:predicted dehydrogenase
MEQKIAIYLEKPLGVDIAASQELVLMSLQKNNTPNVVNFVQASCEALEITQNELKIRFCWRSTIIGIDIVMQYQQWPRSWQVEADWLRFRSAGGYTREVLSHFIFVTERLMGPAKIVFSSPLYPEKDDLCETHIQARVNLRFYPN